MYLYQSVYLLGLKDTQHDGGKAQQGSDLTPALVFFFFFLIISELLRNWGRKKTYKIKPNILYLCQSLMYFSYYIPHKTLPLLPIESYFTN